MPHIRVTVPLDGLHIFPGAHTDPSLQSVSYLAHLHHHMFKITVEMQVFHDEREVELHQFRRWIASLYPDQPMNLGSRSCETIARELHGTIHARYPGRAISIHVDEDAFHGTRSDFDAQGDEIQ
jgi:hypothetical protein